MKNMSEIIKDQFKAEQIAVGKEKINYYIKNSNSNTTIIYVHGAGCNSKIFLPLSSHLNNYNHILIDLPQHGLSKQANLKNSVTDYSDLIINFITNLKDKENLKDIILLGHSLGATIAINTLLKDTNKLIKKCIAIAGIIESSFITEEVLQAVSDDKIFNELVANDTKNFNKDDMGYLNNNILEFIEPAITRTKDFLSAKGYNITDVIDNIHTNVLCIGGDTDTVVPTSQQLLIKNSIKNCELLILPNSGHFVLLQEDNLSIMGKVIYSFINKEF